MMFLTLFSVAAPCHPTDVATSLACDSGVATVTWTPSAGAAYYTVLARVNGHDHTCGSTASSCDLTGLYCGQDYAVILLAGDSVCNSSILTTKTIKTGLLRTSLNLWTVTYIF